MEPEPLDALLRRAAPNPEGEAARCVDDDEFDAGLLLALREGRLAPAEVQRVDTHLLACGFCRRMLGALETAPAAEARMWATLRARRRAPRRIWLGTAVLAAAAAIVFALGLRVEPPPAYEVLGPTGGLALVRSRPGDGARFEPESVLRLVLRPAAPLTVDAPVARAFVAAEDGRLHILPVVLAAAPSGAYVLEAEARALFGPAPGRRVLAIGLAGEVGRLSALDGVPTEEARTARGVHLFEFEIEYTASGDTP